MERNLGGRPPIGPSRTFTLAEEDYATLERWQKGYRLRSLPEALRSLIRWAEEMEDRWPDQVPAG